MSLYQTSVKKPISTALIFIGVLIFGLFSLNKLSVDFYPEIELPTVMVFTYYTGANASDIETNITRPLENSLSLVSNLKKISSTSKENISLITLEFEWGSNLDEASNNIRDALSRIERILPDGAEKPMIFKFSTNLMPVLYLSAMAEESYNGLYKILDEKVANPINRIDGVASVSISGAPQREIQINVDPKKIEAYNMSLEQIGQKVAQENINMPAGSMDIGSESYSLRINGEFMESDIIKTIVLANYNGREIRISDVAEVKDTIRKMTINERINGKPGVSIIVQKQSGSNSVKICKAILDKLPEIQKTLPADVELTVMYDTSEFITGSINSLKETVLFAGLFVMLVILFFLGRWRASLIIIITIPVSLVVSFIYLYISGNTINIISLSSLSIAIGLVVDDAIVVLENITRHIERGSSPKEAAVYATNEVWLAVIATTLTVVAVFLPLTLISGLSGIMFKQLGWSITIVIVVSLFAAISLTPMLSSIMLKDQKLFKSKTNIIYRPIEKFLDWLDDFYARLINWTVGHRWKVIITSILIFLLSLGLFPFIGTELMPTSDNGQIGISMEMPMDVGLEYTQEVVDRITVWIGQEFKDELKIINSSAGIPDENNLFGSMRTTGNNIATFTVRLKKKTERKQDMFEISDKIREHIKTYPEIVKYQVNPGGNRGGIMMGGTPTLDVKVIGYNIEETTRFSKSLIDSIRKNIPTSRDVDMDRGDFRLEYHIDFDRNKLAVYGLNTATASTYVKNRMKGLLCSMYREDGDEYNIVVRYDEPFRKSIEEIENIIIYTPQGKGVKVKELATITEAYATPNIMRENRQRVVTVSSGMYKTSLGQLAKEIQKELDKMPKPQGVDVELAGSYKDQMESFMDLGTLIIIVILLVYIVMATQFESFKMPFIIMVSIIFAISGVLVALAVTGTNLNIVGLIGVVMLVGIVVKNGIVIIDFTNLMRERGLSLRQSVVRAGKSRLRPVLMTALTTILGMLPLAISTGEGAETWRPMGITVIGGLTVSTFLTLLVIPAIYTSFETRLIKKARKNHRKLYGVK